MNIRIETNMESSTANLPNQRLHLSEMVIKTAPTEIQLYTENSLQRSVETDDVSLPSAALLEATTESVTKNVVAENTATIHLPSSRVSIFRISKNLFKVTGKSIF